MEMKKALASLLVGCFAFTSLSAFAAYKKIPGHPRVNQVNRRAARQNARIKQGVKSGQLTKGETHQLRTEHRAVKAEEHSMRKSDNGHLTKADQRKLNRQENHMSRQIYNKKHNNKVAPKAQGK